MPLARHGEIGRVDAGRGDAIGEAVRGVVREEVGSKVSCVKGDRKINLSTFFFFFYEGVIGCRPDPGTFHRISTGPRVLIIGAPPLQEGKQSILPLRAAPHWSDVGKEEYDGRWHPLKNTVETYLRVEAPAYEHFLDEQYHLIRQFIYGRNRR